jgi:biotin carboxyl carrier protein
LKLRLDLDGKEYTLDVRFERDASEYRLAGAQSATGLGSVAEVSPGVYSVLLACRSFTVRVVPMGEVMEVWTAAGPHLIALADARDRSSRRKHPAGNGPVEVCAQMPGKVIKLLAEKGTAVQTGQGLIVVEAMKMQNEMQSPKDGVVARINVVEGATVAAGQPLIVVE